MNYRQHYAIQRQNEERILKSCGTADNSSGIYSFLREENGFKYAYIGQAKNILSRMAQHLSGYKTPIDLSLKKRGLATAENPNGWTPTVVELCENVDEREQYWISEFAKTHQLYNKTTGSQGEGKRALGEGKSPKGYREGVACGEEKTIKKVKTYFEKYLDFSIKGDYNKIKEKKYNEFKEIIESND